MAKQSVARSEIFENMPVPKAIMTLAIPTIMSSLVMVLYNMADTYFVGFLNDPVQSAAVTLASPVLLAFNAVNNLFGVGSSSLMSRAMGSKSYDRVKKASAFGFYCSLFCAVIFSLLCFVFNTPLLKMLGADASTMAATKAYMQWAVVLGAAPSILNVVFAYLVRSEGASLHASIGTMSGCILNMILDPLFIMPWGLNMGSAGAGLATCISNCFACGYFLVLLARKKGNTLVCIDFREFTFQKDIAFNVFSVGIPAAIQNLLNVTSMTIFNNFVAVYGADAVAAMGIAQKIQMIPMQIALGASQGVMPLVSYNYSSENMKRMRETINYILKVLIGFTVALTVVGILFAGPLVRLFMNNDVVVDYGAKFLTGLMLAIPFLCVDFTGVGVFQAVGNGKAALLFAILRKIILEIPAIIILNKIVPLYGMAYSRFVAEFVLAIAAIIMIRKIMYSKPDRTEKAE